MGSPVIKLIRKLSFPLFLISFIMSFFAPELYRTIVFIQFMVLAPIVLFVNYNTKLVTQTIQTIFIVFTAMTLAFGVPGSALGYAISASVGLFVAQSHILEVSKKGSMHFRCHVLAGLTFICGACYLLYSNYKNAFSFDLIGQYFGEASINYATLTVASFCSIFATWCALTQFYSPVVTKRQIIILRTISVFLSASMLLIAVIFTTRSAILGFLPVLLYAFQPKRPQLYFFGILISVPLTFVISPTFRELALFFLVPGRDNLADLYISELQGQERSEAALIIFEKAIPRFSLCINCSKYMSYSGLSNLLALSFPFSLYYLWQMVKFILIYAKNFLLNRTIPKLLLLIIGISFLNSLLLVVFQADFLSTLSLFYVIGVGLCLFCETVLVFRKGINEYKN